MGSGLGGIAVTVLLPLQKGLKMKPAAKLVIYKLTIFACISEYGCEREEAPVLAHLLFSVSSWTLRSESLTCMDGFSFGGFCASFCKNPRLRLDCKNGWWVGTSDWSLDPPGLKSIIFMLKEQVQIIMWRFIGVFICEFAYCYVSCCLRWN